MKEDFVSVNVLIDSSGSMQGLTNDTIGGFNRLLAEQKAAPGTAAFSLYTFNNSISTLHDFKDINEVSDLSTKTYRPDGGTALLDALGTLVDNLGKRLAGMPEEERPCKVMVIVITDGEENASRSYTKAKIHEMITHQEQVYNWSFLFIGASLASINEGASLGVNAVNVVKYAANSVGTQRVYGAMSNSLRRARSMGAGMTSNQAYFNAEELKSLAEEDPIPAVDPAPVEIK